MFPKLTGEIVAGDNMVVIRNKSGVLIRPATPVETKLNKLRRVRNELRELISTGEVKSTAG